MRKILRVSWSKRMIRLNAFEAAEASASSWLDSRAVISGINGAAIADAESGDELIGGSWYFSGPTDSMASRKAERQAESKDSLSASDAPIPHQRFDADGGGVVARCGTSTNQKDWMRL